MEELFKETLLPIIGGFLFIVANWRFRFVALRTSGEKLVLICAVIGIALAVLSESLVSLVKVLIASNFGEDFLKQAHHVRKQLSQYPASQLGALILGPGIGRLLNNLKGWNREDALTRALADVGDQLESRLDFGRRTKKLVMLTLRSGRVYVGWVTRIVPPMLGPKHTCIIPVFSGHRSKARDVEADGHETYGRVKFTTFYEEITKIIRQLPVQKKGETYEVAVSAPGRDGILRTIRFDPADMGIIIPIAEIHAATIFDSNVYAFLNRERDPERWDAIRRDNSPKIVTSPSDKKKKISISSPIRSGWRRHSPPSEPVK